MDQFSAHTSGAAVGGAKITITEQNQNVSRSTTTNESGFYSVPDLPPGLYKVSAEKAGFKMVVRSNLEVSVSSTPHIDLTLQPGSVNETLTVEATLPLLQTDSAQTGADLNSNIAEDLPVGKAHLLKISKDGLKLNKNQGDLKKLRQRP